MDAVFAKRDNRHFRIPIDSILYLKAEGSYLNLVTVSGEFSLSQNLSQFLRKTPFQDLLRVHRSYLINIQKVESFDAEGVWINETKIPVSESRRQEFLDRIHCL
ncbi:MAG: LytTR family DNA-binding domain-containing protein [Cyclobacteriaceae bacterium]